MGHTGFIMTDREIGNTYEMALAGRYVSGLGDKKLWSESKSLLAYIDSAYRGGAKDLKVVMSA